MAVADPPIRRVAIIDDNLNDADAMGELVSDAGFEPVVMEPPFGQMATLLQSVRDRADAAVCDHRLRGLAQFWGAEAVAGLVDQRIPAVLVTQYIDIDADASIRQWRHRVPVLLSRDDADPDRIKEGLGLCSREIHGDYLPGRRPWRALVQVDAVSHQANPAVVDVRIPSWNPHKVVRFPLELVPPPLRSTVVPDAFLFAMVNIGAEDSDDLYFRDFEAAPTPASEETRG